MVSVYVLICRPVRGSGKCTLSDNSTAERDLSTGYSFMADGCTILRAPKPAHSPEIRDFLPAIKLQFSLATLLVCMTVLAMVCVLAVTVSDLGITEEGVDPPRIDATGALLQTLHHAYFQHSPSAGAIAARLALWWPISIVTSLGALNMIRRLKSRRENVPAVG
jgi:hypothetical protein